MLELVNEFPSAAQAARVVKCQYVSETEAGVPPGRSTALHVDEDDPLSRLCRAPVNVTKDDMPVRSSIQDRDDISGAMIVPGGPDFIAKECLRKVFRLRFGQLHHRDSAQRNVTGISAVFVRNCGLCTLPKPETN
jgi:hypothetical protein